MRYPSYLPLSANLPNVGSKFLPLRQVRTWLATQRFYQLALLAILAVGVSLPLRLLDRFPLREDEAIYSFWALHGWREDPFFLTVWPDKPPLFLWLLALAFQVGGASQVTGRLLNMMLTLLTALIIGATARHWWGRRSGMLATLLYLLNPFVISFAPTVYTDPMLVLAGQLALFLAATGRSFGAGVWLAVAIMTKQQGVLYVPLIAGVLGCCFNQRAGVRTWLRFGLGAVIVLAPLLYWDSLRWAVAPSPWDLSVRNYGALQLLSPAVWWARSVAWAKVLWYFTASGPVWGLLIGGIVVALWQRDIRKLRLGQFSWLVLWSLCFLALHVTTSVQIWDRYVLPLAPMLCLIVVWAVAILNASRNESSNVILPGRGQVFSSLAEKVVPPSWKTAPANARFGVGLHFDHHFSHPGAYHWWTVGLLVSLLWLVPPALSASTGGLPIGGDHGAYSGLPEAIDWLKTQTSGKVVLYHQRLGWHYQFYLYDQLATGAYELRWFPNPTYLADNAAKHPYQARFLIEPAWAPQPDLVHQLAVRRSDLVLKARFQQMTVYEIITNPQRPCTWCLCRSRTPWVTLASPDLLLEPR